jgi:Ca2+-transporting ATPase
VFQGLPGRDRLWAIRERHRLRFFDAKEWCIIGAVGVLITLIVAGGYERSLGIGRDVGHARAMALAVLTVASAMLTASLSRLQSGTARVTVAITLAISILLIQTPAFATRLHLVSLHLDDWATAMLGGLLAAARSVATTPRRVTPIRIAGSTVRARASKRSSATSAT